MRRAAIIIAVLTAILLGTCVSSGPINREKPMTAVIENQNWAAATVRFYCNGLRKTAASIEMNRQRSVDVPLAGCRGLTIYVDLLASDRYFISEAIQVHPRDCLKFVIGSQIQHTSWLPCKRS